MTLFLIGLVVGFALGTVVTGQLVIGALQRKHLWKQFRSKTRRSL